MYLSHFCGSKDGEVYDSKAEDWFSEFSKVYVSPVSECKDEDWFS